MQELISTWIARLGAPAFRKVHRFDRALRRKLTPAGWLVASLLVASMIFGLNTRESLLYQLFALTVTLLAVAAVAAWRMSAKVTLVRRLPHTATAGVAFDYTLTIRHAGDGPLKDILVEDVLAVPRGETADFMRYKVAADRERNIFDRLVGYPRWVTFMRQRAGARMEAARMPGLPPGQTVDVWLSCLPLRRGVLRFDTVRLSREEPLGLLKANRHFPLNETLVVMPRTYPAAPLDLPGSRKLQRGGVAFVGHVGDAEEFVSLRDHRPGDGPRRIHWKAWARTGRMVVKEYQDEFLVRHALVLDTFGHPATETFEAAVSLAASLVIQPRASESLLDLMFVEGRAYTFTQGRGLGAHSELLRVLATVSASPQGRFEELAESVLLAAPGMSGTVCVLLDWDAPRQRLIASLRERGVPVRVWLVTDAAQPPAAGTLAADPGNFRVVHPQHVARELMR